jgi:hypothetical protein
MIGDGLVIGGLIGVAVWCAEVVVTNHIETRRERAAGGHVDTVWSDTMAALRRAHEPARYNDPRCEITVPGHVCKRRDGRVIESPEDGDCFWGARSDLFGRRLHPAGRDR